MSKRIIVVSRCIPDYPYMGEAQFDENGKYIGARCEETGRITSKTGMPDWCPLPEAIGYIESVGNMNGLKGETDEAKKEKKAERND